jgi:phosphoglycolate phosphatase-like HAD superfamily hydrolase
MALSRASGGTDRLILFDVDGTLLTTDGLGRDVLARAVCEVYGVRDPFRDYSLAGRTDLQIIREPVRRAGIPEDRIREGLPRVMARHEALLAEAFRTAGRGTLMPGMPMLLDRLLSDRRWGVGLLTGNTRHGARIKLSHFGIWDRFSFGAFGDDDEDRNALPDVARRRAREVLGVDIAPARCLVVGDTPRDIACARAGGMRAVAVATGWDPVDVLEKAAPDLLLRSFEDVHAALQKLDALY